MSINATNCIICNALINVNKINQQVKEGTAMSGGTYRTWSTEDRLKSSLFFKGKFVGDENPSKRPEVRQKISAKALENNYIRGKTLEEYFGEERASEIRKTHRENHAKRIENGERHPTFYNKSAIPIIDEYGKENGYNFQHAENGGEVTIIGYWVDGYDKEKNVVIEYYERAHYNIDGSLKCKELKRENEIINFLKCIFIRINAFDRNKLYYEVIGCAH